MILGYSIVYLLHLTASLQLVDSRQSVFEPTSLDYSNSSITNVPSFKDSPGFKKFQKIKDNVSLEKLKNYLRINTAHPHPNYVPAINFLREYATELKLSFQQFQCSPDHPMTAIMTWKGKNPSLPSLILNSHTDVVPVTSGDWKFDPFNATVTKDSDGREIIVGRGSQDCKSLGIMYLEAIRNLLTKFPKGPERTLHLTFVPDEEIGGAKGIVCLAQSKKFKEFFGEIGLVLDEGFPSPDERVWAFYGERVQRGFKVTAKGTSGHGSQFITNLATDKLAAFESKARFFRYKEQRRMERLGLPLGQVTTLNLNLISGGSEINVVPGVVTASYDVRVDPFTNLTAFQETVLGWGKESGVEVEFLYNKPPSITNITSNYFWKKLQEAAKDFGLPLTPGIFPAATDSRHLRVFGIPAIGITPIHNHPVQAHAADESLQLDAFYQGIQFYTHVLPGLFN